LIKFKTILFLTILLIFSNVSFSNEKFVKVKGILTEQSTNQPIKNFKVKVVLDGIDSTETTFEEEKFEIWLPANRKAKLFFIKMGYTIKYLLVDASFIPEFAYKKKQLIELNVPLSKDTDKLKGKPFCVADFKASESKFVLTYTKIEKKHAVTNKNFRPPFPPPVETYKNARPSNKNLETTLVYNENKAKKTHPMSVLIQGVLFADLNYCVFNERVGKANEYLIKLSEIDKSKWGNIKPFDSPEYGAIVMKTLNREKSTDTLFAVGAWIETTRLLLQSFTSNSKIILSNKKLIYLYKKYKGSTLLEPQKEVYIMLKELVIVLKELEEKFMDHLRLKKPFEMINDETFLNLKEEINKIYNHIIT